MVDILKLLVFKLEYNWRSTCDNTANITSETYNVGSLIKNNEGNMHEHAATGNYCIYTVYTCIYIYMCNYNIYIYKYVYV